MVWHINFISKIWDLKCQLSMKYKTQEDKNEHWIDLFDLSLSAISSISGEVAL